MIGEGRGSCFYQCLKWAPATSWTDVFLLGIHLCIMGCLAASWPLPTRCQWPPVFLQWLPRRQMSPEGQLLFWLRTAALTSLTRICFAYWKCFVLALTSVAQLVASPQVPKSCRLSPQCGTRQLVDVSLSLTFPFLSFKNNTILFFLRRCYVLLL